MNTEYHEDTIYSEVDDARSMLRELADCDALWRKLTPTIAREARDQAAFYRRVLTSNDPSDANERNIWLRDLFIAGMTGDPMMAWAKADQ
jgi:hypothetical protein